MGRRDAVRAFVGCIAFHLGAVACAVFAQAPRVDGLSPAQGPIGGGTAVTITGVGFTPGTAVFFNRNAAANVQVLDSAHLQVTTPPLGSGPFATALAAVRLTNAGGTTYGEFLYVPPSFNEIRIGDITTIAGVGSFVGDGRLATQAMVDAQAIAFDAAGNVYLGEENGGIVRKVGLDGRITTIAGSNIIGFAGDGGPAIDAEFNWPVGVAVDRSGNVFISDGFGNSRIRRIDPSGIVRTIAGTAQPGFSGDGGPAAQAQLRRPTGIVLDAAGNVFFVDAGNQRIRRIDAATGVITTVAGNGAAGFSGDGGQARQASFNMDDDRRGTLAIDSRGNLFVIDGANARVRRIDASGVITTVVGGGSQSPAPGIAATQVFVFCDGVAVDAQDRVVFGEPAGVWRVETNGTITRLGGSGSAGLSADGARAADAAMSPAQVAVAANGDILVSERVARRIRRISASTGLLSTFAGIGPAAIGDGGSSALAAVFGDVGNLALDPGGNILAVDGRGSLRIRRIDTAGKMMTVGGNGIAAVRGFYAEGVAPLSAGMAPVSVQQNAAGAIYFTDFCSLRRIASNAVRTVVGPTDDPQRCGYAGDGGPGTSALVAAEQNVVRLDAQGNAFIADQFNMRIRKWDAASGIVTTFAGSGPAAAPGGYFPGGQGSFGGDGGPATQALLNNPTDVAFDSRRGTCIADLGNERIRCVNAQGAIGTIAGGTFNEQPDGVPATSTNVKPYRLAFDAPGNLYMTDFGHATIRRIDTNGVITTVAGTSGRPGFSGDGGPARDALIDYGSGMVVDAYGNILFYDGGNRRIRVIKQSNTFAIGGGTSSANTPGALSGLWWNQNESGWGIHFTQRANIVFAAWYTYNLDGNPQWYVSTCAMPVGTTGTAGTCNGILYEVNGPTFFGTAFNPQLANAIARGNLQVTFQNADNASMTYTGVVGQTRTVAITRQPLAAGTTPPAVNYTDIWWSGPSESGWGMAITQQFSTMFLAWYVYDNLGKPFWYVATCTLVGTSCSGDVLRTTGPAFGAAFNPSQVHAFTAGTINVSFSDGNNATLNYTVNGIGGTKSITRQLF